MGAVNIFSLLMIFQAVLYSDCQKNLRFFRKDYTYISITENFYKIHTVPQNWNDAKNRCEMEGATLFYPEDETEASKVIEFWKITQTMKEVLIGVTHSLEKFVYTVDGVRLRDVYNKWTPGEPEVSKEQKKCVILNLDGTLRDDDCDNKFHYICKKRLSELEWNESCNMPGSDYIYNPNENHCYKFHTDSKNWMDALTVCEAENSYLAIVNSQAEMDHLVTLMKKTDRSNSVTIHKDQALLGFHNRHHDGWKTISGQKLEDAGFIKWGIGQPSGSEYCGSMFDFGEFNDIPCDRVANFICERDVTEYHYQKNNYLKQMWNDFDPTLLQ